MRRLLTTLVVIVGCGGGPTEDPTLPCTDDGTTVHCPRHVESMAGRGIHWKRARDEASPVVFLFQGSTVSASHSFDGKEGDAWGGLFQARTVAALVDAGYVVIAPEAAFGGLTAWATNVPPWSTAWESSADFGLMQELFAQLDAGHFGAVDTSRFYAAGISSGGYMTSRMALAYPGKFKALAIAAASYATCAGSACSVPAMLPTDHPPTVFLHGEKDQIVPVSSMLPYRDGLEAQGTEVKTELDAEAGHEWLKTSPEVVRDFFVGH